MSNTEIQNNNMNVDELWSLILNDLKKAFSPMAFDMAIRPLGVKSYSNNILTLITSNPAWNNLLKTQRFSDNILIALKKYSRNPEANFKVILDKTYVPENVALPKKNNKAESTTTTQTQLPLNEVQIDALKFLSSYGINVKYDFDNFVVSKSNKYAFGAAKQVAQNPGKVFNPLFIWGGAGLGKTHLVNAIGKNILIKHPDLKLKYVTMNDFTSEFTKIVFQYKGDARRKNEFVNKYRDVDVLIIDDVQFLEGRDATQTEMFNIFEFLYRNGKHIILTSDRPPKDIPTLTDRLRTRFEWGVRAEIKSPEYETRIEILKLKAKEENIDIPDEVIELIAKSFNNNVRELEGALNCLAGWMSIEEEPVTVEVATELLNLNDLKKKLTANDIIDIVSEYYKIEPSEIKGDSRSKEIVTPRYVAIYLTRELTKASLPSIGDVFGNRKHATILYAYEHTKEKLEQDFEFKKEVNGLKEKIKKEFSL